MDLAGILNVINVIGAGGPRAVIAILILIIVGLLLERRQLQKTIVQQHQRTDQIVDDYHRGNLTLADAITSFKAVLYDLRIRSGF